MMRLESFTEGVAIALWAIRDNKLRSSLTILGVVIGVATVMAMASIVKERGFDAVVDTTGINDVRAACYEATTNKGVTIFAGVPHLGDRLAIDSFPLHFGRRLVGSHGGETVPDVDIPRYVALYKAGKLRLDELITHRFQLAEINAAVDCVRRGEAGRCVVAMPPA